MKCLCFSDSHGDSYLMRRALLMHRDTEVVFFLGDGLSDLFSLKYDFPNVAFFPVRGNCDYQSVFSDIPKTQTVNLMNKKIAITHGDLYGVKGGVGNLLSLAAKERLDLVLFGHTHTPLEYYYSDGAVYLFNPGSISASYGGRSYGIITLTERDILLSHGRLDY